MHSTASKDRLAHDDLLKVERYCAALAHDGRLPLWQDFRPADIGRIVLPNLSVFEVLDGGRDFYIRLGGGILPQIFGIALSGQRLSQATDANIKLGIRRILDEVIASRRPLWKFGTTCWPDGGSFQIEILHIPFSRGHDVVDIILCGVLCCVPHEDLVLFRGKGIGVTTFDAPESPAPDGA